MTSIYPKNRFYISLGLIIVILVSSTWLSLLYWIGFGLLALLLSLVFIDGFLLIKESKSVSAIRKVVPKLSLGDDQQIQYKLNNDSEIRLFVEIVDELPEQFQHRDIIGSTLMDKKSEKKYEFHIYPTERGSYVFGNLMLYISNPSLGFLGIQRITQGEVTTRVYPSILQMKKYALFVLYKAAHQYGIRKIRTIGENDEFEHIRHYQIGDNERSINWKATSKTGELLINQYQDTRSQNVFCIIDKGRSMEMPFHSLALLDYAINSALVTSNIVLQKYDKIGLITFSKSVETILAAESGSKQLELILESLYKQQTEFKESNFEILYLTIRKKIAKRSIVFLYTNFESKSDLDRNLKYLTLLSRQHLLVVIMFINTELHKKTETKAVLVSDIYDKTIAASLLVEKEQLAITLNNAGIQTILTKPEDLNVNVLNKYLEIKAKRSK